MNNNSKPADSNVQPRTAEIIPFKFEAREVRTLLINDQPWFVAADVCSALGYANTSKAISDNCRVAGVTSSYIRSGGQSRSVKFINEGNLYRLIIKSRKEEAQRFESWVCDEVLPAIRKHGRYDDSEGKISTLIGQTIGTDGFHCLGAVLDGKVRQLPVKARQRAKMHVWSQVHKAFSVVSAQDIPANQLDSVRNFIAAYALEGEWLGKEESKTAKHIGGIFLDRRETQHLYLMMFRFSKMNEQSGNLRLAAQALASDPLSKLWSQLHEGMVSFKVLDQRRAEICGEYQAIGGSGGYAFCA